MRKLLPKPVTLFWARREDFVAGGLQAEVTRLLDKIRAGKAGAKSRFTVDA